MRKQLLALGLAALALAAGACRRGGDVVRIGTILGLTGPNASYGQKMLAGFRFAIDEINGRGGINGAPIELVVEDSQFDPTKAVAAYRRLTAAAGIRIIVGITGSKNALAVCSAARSDDVLILDALRSAPKLSAVGGRNYFRIMASDVMAGRYIVRWALESGTSRPMIVYQEDEWGASYRDALLAHLREAGVERVPTLGVLEGTRDFKTHVQRLKLEQADTVFLLLYAGTAAAFMRDMRLSGVRAAVYGSDNLSSAEFAAAGSEAVDGVRVAMPAPPRSPALDAFVAAFKKKPGTVPDANVIKSYDAMCLAAAAIRLWGLQPARIAAWFRSPDFSFQGVSGPIRFDTHGDLVTQEYTRMVYNRGELRSMP